MQRSLITLTLAATLPISALVANDPVAAASPPPAAQTESASAAAQEAARRAEHVARESARSARATEREDAMRELAIAREELSRTSARVAELAQTLAREQVEAALARPALDRPVIGVVMGLGGAGGVRLAAVTPEGPAARAGLRSGDVLVRINGTALDAPSPEARLQQAREAIGDLQTGQRVEIGYQREGTMKGATLVAEPMPGLVWWSGREGDPGAFRLSRESMLADLARLPDSDWRIGMIAPLAGCADAGESCLHSPLAQAWRWRGLRLAAVDARLGRYFGAERGVLVLGLPQEDVGELEPGDVILRVGAQEVDEPRQVLDALSDEPPGSRITLRIMRDRRPLALTLEAPQTARLPLLAPLPPMPPAAPTPRAAPAPQEIPVPAPVPQPLTPPAPRTPASPPPPPPPPADLGLIDRALLLR